MIDRGKLLSDLQAVLRKLEADLLERSDSREVQEFGQTLRNEYQKAQKANRTAQSYEEWRSDYITQVAAAWVLSCVFARFLEDNRLVDPPRLSGPGERLTRARDEHELYFRAHPTQTDREYLLHIFDELRKLPGAKEIFGEHNAVHELPNWLSGDGAGELLKFFQRIDANTGALIHDFIDPTWDTRFLGDLYQDLSETARKKYALLQTPVFVEEFILDRTLDPAIEEFGLEGFRMIDPASGSGHFLLGSFHRILQRWLRKEPGTNVRVLVQRTLDSIHGVDVNPYAVAIARFRLLLIALRESGISRLQDAPDFHFNLAAGDSLLHGVPGREQEVMGFHELAHHYQAEDLTFLRRILKPGTYHVVVANPPYITVKDRALNQAYRDRFSACHLKYALSVPFVQRIFELGTSGAFIGQITANSFATREFGKKLVEKYLPTKDITHLVDTSGVYIPGHTTPTIIIFGRNCKPVRDVIRAVLGIRGEESPLAIPANGKVWNSIVSSIDELGYKNPHISVADTDRKTFSKHPWSLGGGGAAELKQLLDERATNILRDAVSDFGIFGMSNADDIILARERDFLRRKVESNVIRPVISGDDVREWQIWPGEFALYPYKGNNLISLEEYPGLLRWLWPARTVLGHRATFDGRTYFEEGKPWWSWHQLSPGRLSPPRSIVFPEIATHNHFALDDNGEIYRQTAPVIKMHDSSNLDEYAALLAILNSSTICFWLKQVANCKGLGGQGGGIKPEDWHRAYAFNVTKVGHIPLRCSTRLAILGRKLLAILKEIQDLAPERILNDCKPWLSKLLEEANHREQQLFGAAAAVQEEIDWSVYSLFELCEETIVDEPSMDEGICTRDRPLERTLRRQIRDGQKSIYYDVHRAPPTGAIRLHGEGMESVIQDREKIIDGNAYIALIETANYKRRWQIPAREHRVKTALQGWLLLRLESYFDLEEQLNVNDDKKNKINKRLIAISKLSDIAMHEVEFMTVADLYSADPAFAVQKLIHELVSEECVPLLPVLRYKDTGLRKRAEWEQTWDLQRREDAIDSRTTLPIDHPDYLSEIAAKDLKKNRIGDIPVPPKYTSADFLSGTFWRLRGKLDVPTERWVSFPYCEGEDGQMVIAWAGYDHLHWPARLAHTT